MGVPFVVDNSVVMAWCFKDETSDYADSVLEELAVSTAFVPPIWPLEVVNVLLVAVRRKRLSESDSLRFLTLLAQLPIIVDDELPDTIMTELLALAMANDLSSYDASYLDLSIRRGLPIATLDNRLMKAANKISVPIFQP